MPQFAPWISPFLLSVSNPREKYDNCAWLKLTIAHLPTRLLTRLIINPFANIRGRITQLQNCVSWWKIGQVFERSPLFFLEFQVKIHIIRIYFPFVTNWFNAVLPWWLPFAENRGRVACLSIRITGTYLSSIESICRRVFNRISIDPCISHPFDSTSFLPCSPSFYGYDNNEWIAKCSFFG